MSRVYSTQLNAVNGAGGGTTDLGGPGAGFVWVVRHMSVTYNVALSSALGGFIVALAAGPALWQVGPVGVQNQRVYQWAGRHVLNPTDTLSFLSDDAAQYNVLVSGYTLALP